MRITGDSVDQRIEKFNSWKDKLPNYEKRGVEKKKGDNITICKGTFEEDGTYHKEWMFTHNLVTNDGDIYYAKKITLLDGNGSAYGDTNFASDGLFFHHDGVTTVSASTVYGAMILGSASVTPHQDNTYGAVGTNGTGSAFSTGAYDAAGLFTNSNSVAINTTKTLSTNYPRFNDREPDNTGGNQTAGTNGYDEVTWAYEWTKGNFDTTGASDLTGGVIVDRGTNATPASSAKLLCHFNFASAFEKTGNDTLKVFVNHTFEGA